MDHKVNGKPLSECTAAELASEHNAGMCLDATDGLSETQMERLRAIEAEIDRRPQAEFDALAE